MGKYSMMAPVNGILSILGSPCRGWLRPLRGRMIPWIVLSTGGPSSEALEEQVKQKILGKFFKLELQLEIIGHGDNLQITSLFLMLRH